MSSRLRSCTAALLAIALYACASTHEPAVLHFGIEDAPEGRNLLWPAPPEVPRLQYAGQLVGETNFRSASTTRKHSATSFLRWVVGLDEHSSKPVVLQRPQSGMVDTRNRILVTDASRQAVFVFDSVAGELHVWDRASAAKGFVAPVGIASGRNEEVLVADAELAQVVRLDAQGKPIGSIGKGVLQRPTGLARDGERGVIYVADTRAHDVKLFNDDGGLMGTLGRRGTAEGEFNAPTHLAFSNGLLYVTDSLNNRVQVFERDQALPLRRIGKRGLYLGNLVRPKGVAADSEGNVYVVEGYYDYLLVYNNGGQFLMPIGGTGQATGNFFLPAGVWSDANNRIFVADMFNGRVVIFQFLGGG
ncbi:MAG TPA: 6-bladed beta-propeller [Burkholderiales bacterium]|nr:6-bladed beta-propeller [Burkholderiales bacterium]